MELFENLTLSLQGVWSHKMRSFLTMLGIIIGIASIITIVSTIRGTTEQIKNSLVGSGTNTVTVQLYQGDNAADLSYSGIPDGVTAISDSTLEELREIEHVEDVSLCLRRNWIDGAYAGDRAFSGAVYAVDANYFRMLGYSLSCGRLLLEEDYSLIRKVCVLDETAAHVLFSSEYPVGQSVEIHGEPMTVVGVVRRSGGELEIRDLNDYYSYANAASGVIFLPTSVWPVIFRFDEPQSVVLGCDSTDSMTAVGQTAAKLLTAYQINDSESKFSYRAEDLMEQAEQLQELSNSTNRQLLWIASISLLVGGIGVMNIMLVTVTERTREIGLKKAIGARRKHILNQFLTEAAVLTSLGGILGVLAGVILARLISSVLGSPMAFSPGATAVAVIFSTVIGILFGLLPAVKAANLNPIDALRRE